MSPLPPPALDQARNDWLAGDRDAWARYLACLRPPTDGAPPADPQRPRSTRRIVRRRGHGPA